MCASDERKWIGNQWNNRTVCKQNTGWIVLYNNKIVLQRNVEHGNCYSFSLISKNTQIETLNGWMMFYPRLKRCVSTPNRKTEKILFLKCDVCLCSIFRHPVHSLICVSCVVVLINEFFIYTIFRWTWPSLKCNSGNLEQEMCSFRTRPLNN